MVPLIRICKVDPSAALVWGAGWLSRRPPHSPPTSVHTATPPPPPPPPPPLQLKVEDAKLHIAAAVRNSVPYTTRKYT